MTLRRRPRRRAPRPSRPTRAAATGLLAWLTTTDHKAIGIALHGHRLRLLPASAGVLAAAHPRRAGPARTQTCVGRGTYNQLFTMHGSIMMFLFAVPVRLRPGQLPRAAADRRARHGVPPPQRPVATGSTCSAGSPCCPGFLTAGGAADFGWYGLRAAVRRRPLARRRRPTCGSSASLLTGVAGVAHRGQHHHHRDLPCGRPGMTMFRMPIFTWNMLVTQRARAAGLPGAHRRRCRCSSPTATSAPTSSTPPAAACPILWQHLFWFFGHPEVYIVALPFFGVVTEVFPVFSRQPGVRLQGLRLRHPRHRRRCRSAVWAHHMFATGAVLLPFFSAHVVSSSPCPTGVKFFNWIGTMWGGQLTLRDADAVLPSGSCSCSCSAA